MASVTFDNVTKRFGDFAAINNLSLEVPDKEFLVFVGPSGSGKTTALRMLAGLEDITEGSILIGDRVVNNVAARDRDIAMVFQSYALYPHMSVYDNMGFGLSIRGMAKAAIESRVRQAAQILEIEELLGRKPGALSGGQRQRVALGRAIVREPAVFLMDEPLSNLDAKLRVQTRTELVRLQERLQTTVIYVTHDQVEAMTMGTRIAILDWGVLQQLDTPQRLYSHPANQFVAGFIGSPSMNFFNGELFQADGEVAFRVDDMMLKLDHRHREALTPHLGAPVVLGIRPEHIADRRLLPEESSPAVVRSRVEAVEALGNETFLHLASPLVPTQPEFVARMGPDIDVRLGQDIDLVFDVAKAHIFAKPGGEAIA